MGTGARWIAQRVRPVMITHQTSRAITDSSPIRIGPTAVARIRMGAAWMLAVKAPSSHPGPSGGRSSSPGT
jgi:hypothetical protein